MSTSIVETPPIDLTALADFQQHLNGSTRIMALCGAGLSAASGLPTFRGAGGYWRKNDAISLATPEAFSENPSLVWQFYSYRRHMSVIAQPNKAHIALAQLGRKFQSSFLTVTQNVDGLSQRANHPPECLALLHGSLATVKCTSFSCDYVEENNFKDPIVPALAIPQENNREVDISNAEVPLREVAESDLPRCPKCKNSLLRPGVVWFGEALPVNTIERVNDWMRQGVDLLLVIGTSATVYPAAGYIHSARHRGARVAVINTEHPTETASALHKGDWFFQGDAGIVVPQILESLIGSFPYTAEKL